MQPMTIIRILPLALLLAACAARARPWAPVPAGTDPTACTAVRLAARGYAVDTAKANVIQATFREPDWETVVTATVLPPGDRDRIRITSNLFDLRGGKRESIGMHITRQVEVHQAMHSCGFIFG